MFIFTTIYLVSINVKAGVCFGPNLNSKGKKLKKISRTLQVPYLTLPYYKTCRDPNKVGSL